MLTCREKAAFCERDGDRWRAVIELDGQRLPWYESRRSYHEAHYDLRCLCERIGYAHIRARSGGGTILAVKRAA
jgi:hypothetical protein